MGLPGQLQIRLGSQTAPPVSPNPFDNDDGQDIIIAQTGSSGFLFVDQVPAALKPQFDGDFDRGIKVQGGSGGTLRIEAGDDDTLIDVQGTIVIVDEPGLNFGASELGSGVSKLIIRTNDVDAAGFYPDGGTVLSVDLANGIDLVVDTGAGTFDRIFLDQVPASADAIVITSAENCIVSVSSELSAVTALVDFKGGALGLGNKLFVLGLGTATLANAPGSSAHTIYVDEVDVTGSASNKIASLIVADVSSIGTFKMQSEHSVADFTADATVDNFNECEGTVNVLEGAVTVQNKSELHDLNVLGNDAELLFKDTDDASGITHVDSMVVAAGGLITVQARNQTPTSSSARQLSVNTIAVSTDAPSGTFDLKDNLLFVEYSGSSPLSDIQAAITSAYNGGAWTGLGISSSTAAAIAANQNETHKTAVGFAEATDLSSPATFEGHSIDNTTIIVKYTWYGDANLSGSVNLADFNRLAANFGQSSRRWVHGDFNFNGTVNLPDFNLLAGNFGQAGGLGTGTAGECEEYTYQELQEMLPN